MFPLFRAIVKFCSTNRLFTNLGTMQSSSVVKTGIYCAYLRFWKTEQVLVSFIWSENHYALMLLGNSSGSVWYTLFGLRLLSIRIHSKSLRLNNNLYVILGSHSASVKNIEAQIKIRYSCKKCVPHEIT